MASTCRSAAARRLAWSGESGCGKTTVGRLLLRLIEPTAGTILFDGTDITALKGSALKPYRRRMQIIFQDPYSTLDPRTPDRRQHRRGPADPRPRDARRSGASKVRRMMDLVGLQPYHARRYPHEFSGGQRQRIGIARALVLEPDLVVCDEPVSALDVSIQAQVLNLLKQLQRELGLTYLFVAHNMGVVEHISDRVAVMYLGRIAELAGRETLFRTRATRTPRRSCPPSPCPDPTQRGERIILTGDVPSPVNPPAGCRFHPRCSLRARAGLPGDLRRQHPAAHPPRRGPRVRLSLPDPGRDTDTVRGGIGGHPAGCGCARGRSPA